MTDHVKRVYRSQLRQAAAAETRERVLVAASELFITRGYPGTTLKEVAERAGVGERTLYDKFGDKLELFKQCVRYRTRGDDQPIPHPERPDTIAVFESTDPHQIIELHMDYGANLLDRAGDLIMAGIVASGTEPQLADNAGRAAESVHAIHLRVTQHLQQLGQLRPGLDPVVAADILYAIGGPATYQALRRQRGWSLARYKQWMIDTAEQQLLKPRDSVPGTT